MWFHSAKDTEAGGSLAPMDLGFLRLVDFGRGVAMEPVSQMFEFNKIKERMRESTF